MRESRYWLVAAALACGAGRLAAAPTAEQPAPVADPGAAQATLNSSEDVALLKALMSLGLTRSQLSDLLPALQGAQSKLAEQDAKEAAKLAAWKRPLEQARRDLLARTGSGSRASEQFALAQWTAAQNRARLRADLVSSLRATLEKILTPDQATQMAQSGQAALMAQRMAGWRAGGRGGPGGGGGLTGRLDRMRQMSPAEFQDFSQRQADRMGGQTSPQFQQYVGFMNQVRDMPQSQYLLQRDQLAAQSLGRGGFGPGGANNDEAIRAFVERYLLSPRAPIVIRDRLQSQ